MPTEQRVSLIFSHHNVTIQPRGELPDATAVAKSPMECNGMLKLPHPQIKAEILGDSQAGTMSTIGDLYTNMAMNVQPCDRMYHSQPS